jgi:hypothetical protein
VATLNSAPSIADVVPTDGESPATPEPAVADAPTRGRHRLPVLPRSRGTYALSAATVGALIGITFMTGGPAALASADPQEQSSSASVADALGIEGAGVDVPAMEQPGLLDQLAASRSERDAEQAAAAAAQAQAEQAAAAAKAAAEAEAKAAAEAAAAAQAAAAKAAAATPAAPAAPAASVAAGVVAKITNSAGPVKPVVQAAANAVVSNVPGAAGITLGGTRASATDPHGHPSGLALDYMCAPALGDAIVAYHRAHWDELHVEYIIWQQRMLSSPNGSWTPMEDRGSPTANHMDHVHVNYRG